MSPPREVAPDLMLPPRENLHPQQGEAAAAQESPGGQDLNRRRGKKKHNWVSGGATPLKDMSKLG